MDDSQRRTSGLMTWLEWVQNDVLTSRPLRHDPAKPEDCRDIAVFGGLQVSNFKLR